MSDSSKTGAVEIFIERFVNVPSDYQPSGPTPSGDGSSVCYGWFDQPRAIEMLKGDHIKLPGMEILANLDLSNPQAILEEVRRAWIGGFISGQLFGHIQADMILEEAFEGEDPQLLEQLSRINFDGCGKDREPLNWLSYTARWLQEKLHERSTGDRVPRSKWV